MLKKLLLLSFLLLFLFPKKALANDNFSTSYDVTYQVLDDGSIQSSEKITLKNLTKDYYPNNFKLIVNSTQISEVKAQDSTGPLVVVVTPDGSQSTIGVNFTQQIIGLGKELPWVLSFKTKDFSQKVGKILEIKIPKIPSDVNIDDYNLTILVPKNFGEVSAITPKPVSQSENDQEIFKFNKNQLLNSGITLIFGNMQLFDFNMLYHLQNEGLLPLLKSINLPPDTSYQDVIFKTLSPKPINTTVDEDGNFLAWYRLKGDEKLDIVATGSARVYLNPKFKNPSLDANLRQRYTTATNIWQKNNPGTIQTLNKILGQNWPLDTQPKMDLIYQYVVKNLKQDEDFADFFITLVRATGTPARRLDGFGFSQNQALRATSNGAHNWSEYFDDKLGWIMVDPAWENSSGADYFHKLDLDHFAFAVQGTSNPTLAQKISVTLGQNDFVVKPEINIDFAVANPIWAGIPSKVTIKIENKGMVAIATSKIGLTSQELNLNNSQIVGTIPPFGSYAFDLYVKSPSLFDSFTDNLTLTINNQKFEKQIKIMPFFLFQSFPLLGGVVLAIIWIFYFALVGVFIHKKRFKNKRTSK